MKPSISASSISLRPVSGKKQRPSNTIHCSLVRLVKVGAPKEGRHPADGSCMISGSPPAQDFVFRTRSRGYLKAVRRQPSSNQISTCSRRPKAPPTCLLPHTLPATPPRRSSIGGIAPQTPPRPQCPAMQQLLRPPRSSRSHDQLLTAALSLVSSVRRMLEPCCYWYASEYCQSCCLDIAPRILDFRGPRTAS